MRDLPARPASARTITARPPAPTMSACRRSASTRSTRPCVNPSPVRTLSRPPHEHRADRVVPHRAHHGAAEARDPPDIVVRIDPARDADIRYRADPANDHEAHESGEIGK